MAEALRILVKKDAGQIERFSAEELSAYVSAMTGRKADIASESHPNSICIGFLPDSTPLVEKNRLMDELHNLHKDGFIIRSIGDNLIIHGKTPRATLYGVYHYLRMLGVRWYFPGRDYEFIPKRDDTLLKNVDIIETPDMEHRGVVIFSSESAFHDWIDFAPKAKLNAIHLHSDEMIHQMPELLASRGLEFNMRRHFFGEEYSPDDKDRLERDKSLLLKYISTLPSQLNEFFLWPADMPLKLHGVGKNWSIPDAVLMFTNEMADAIRKFRPSARMSFLAYWSTWGVPESVRPAEGVFLEIAHMHQCFSHSIADPECPINSGEVLPTIEGLLQIFDPSETHVLGYWLDASLFGRGNYKSLSGRLPQAGEIMRQDIEYYKSKGVRNISTFAVGLDKGYFSKYASPSIFQYPALLWDSGADLRSELIGFCENFYGDRSLSDIFELNEQIDPRDRTPQNHESLRRRFSRSESIVREIVQKTSNDTYILRLERLLRELKRVSSWVEESSDSPKQYRWDTSQV